MCEGKSSVSNAKSYLEMGEFWDTHDSSDYWDEVPAVEFDAAAESQDIYYPLDIALAMRMREIAKRKGVLPRTLLAGWVREKLTEAARDRTDEVSSRSSV